MRTEDFLRRTWFLNRLITKARRKQASFPLYNSVIQLGSLTNGAFEICSTRNSEKKDGLMGLERRGNGTYYYKKERVNGRVVSRYVGKGQLAKGFALLDREGQEEKEFERNERRKEFEPAKALIEFERLEWATVEAMFTTFMESAGYHKRKGEWRKRRAKKSGE